MLNAIHPYGAGGVAGNTRTGNAAETINAAFFLAGKVGQAQRFFEGIGDAMARGAFGYLEKATPYVTVEPAGLWHEGRFHGFNS